MKTQKFLWGGTARGSIFRDTGGGIRIDQNAGNCIGQFLLDYHDIVRGRGTLVEC